MRRQASAPETHTQDLTARARIRDAALDAFAEQGIKGATIRGIAVRAGVSPGLVQHHFGAKEALREACDAYVLSQFRRQKEALLFEGQAASFDFLHRVYTADGPLAKYLARSLAENTPAAASFFDELVKLSEEMLSRIWPERYPPGATATRDLAAVICSLHAGLMLMESHLSRSFGGDSLSAANLPRISRAMLEVYSGRLLDPRIAEQIHSYLDQIPTQPASARSQKKPGQKGKKRSQ